MTPRQTSSRTLGVITLCARTASIGQQVLPVPAPVVASILGYHHETAIKLATDAGHAAVAVAHHNGVRIEDGLDRGDGALVAGGGEPAYHVVMSAGHRLP